MYISRMQNHHIRTYNKNSSHSVSLLFLICTVPVIFSDGSTITAGNNKEGLHFSFISNREISTNLL